MKNLKIEVLVGLAVTVLSYFLIVLGLRGTLISTLIGASLLCYGIYSLDPARMVFRKKPVKVPLNIYLVYRIGISTFAFSVYFLVNSLLLHIFSLPWWLLLFEIFPIASSLLITIVLIIFMYIFQVAFVQVEYLENLSKVTKIRYIEITFLILGISWFFSVGGGDFMNLVILPIFVTYTIIRKLHKISKTKLNQKLLKRVLDITSTPKRLFITTLTNLAQRKEKTRIGYIVFSCAILLMLNFRYYHIGNLCETLFLSLVFAIVGLTYLSLVRKWHRLILLSIALLLFGLMFGILYFPYCIPLIRFSIEMNVYPTWIPTWGGDFPTEFVVSLLPILLFSVWMFASLCVPFLTQIIYADFIREIEKEQTKKKPSKEIEMKNARKLTLIALSLQLSISLLPIILVWILSISRPMPWYNN